MGRPRSRGGIGAWLVSFTVITLTATSAVGLATAHGARRGEAFATGPTAPSALSGLSPILADEPPAGASPAGPPSARPSASPSASPPAEPSAAPVVPRPFRLGTTPFPYDTTPEAVDFTYDALTHDTDLIAHSFDSGVPWPEALSGAPYPASVLADWELRRSRTPAGHRVYVAITPIDFGRTKLAPYWGTAESQPLPAPWDSYAFDDPAVERAFLNHAENVIAYFHPDYLAIGIEVNLLLAFEPTRWDAYIRLQRYVYGELKRRHPSLPVFATVHGVALLDGYAPGTDHAQQVAGLRQVLDASDLYAISLYPYGSTYGTGPLPTDMWDRLLELSDKPTAIAESGYPAETLSLDHGTFTLPSTEETQRWWIASLLAEAQRRRFVFVVNYVLRDYDALAARYNLDGIALMWRDTGLYAGDGRVRPALRDWRAALATPYERVSILGWTPRADAPAALTHAAGATFRGELWVVGGVGADGSVTRSVWRYDPGSDQWTSGPALPRGLEGAALVATDRDLYVIGGSAATDERAPVSVTWRLSTDETRWLPGPALPAPRAAGAAAWDGTRVVFAGGVDVAGRATRDVYVLTGGRWRRVGALSGPRRDLAAASDGQGRVWLLGGRVGARGTEVASVQIVLQSRVKDGGSLPTARAGGGAAWTSVAGACVAGGAGPTGPVAAVECIDASGRASILGDLAHPRSGVVVGAVGRAVVAALGGTPAAGPGRTVEAFLFER